LFVLGWMAHRAATPVQRWTTVAATLVLVPTFFDADALRTLIVVGGLLLLLFRPTITAPRAVVTAATTLASASLGIYLTHFGVLPLGAIVPPEVVVAVAIAVGMGATTIFDAIARTVPRRCRPRGSADQLACRVTAGAALHSPA
jgi:hypothetical protein